MKKLYLDMDGVLSDFEGSFSGNYGPDTLKTRDKKLWTQEWPDFILNKKGFETLPWWPGGQEMVKFAKELAKKGIEVEILTSSGGEKYHSEVQEQKVAWLKKNGIAFKPNVVPGRKHKKDYAGPGIVLVDDTKDVIDAFNKAGGIGILHKDIGETIEKIKALLA
jgi:hypothetical protein